MSADGRDGAFFYRLSTAQSGSVVLSMCWSKEVHHFVMNFPVEPSECTQAQPCIMLQRSVMYHVIIFTAVSFSCCSSRFKHVCTLFSPVNVLLADKDILQKYLRSFAKRQSRKTDSLLPGQLKYYIPDVVRKRDSTCNRGAARPISIITNALVSMMDTEHCKPLCMCFILPA